MRKLALRALIPTAVVIVLVAGGGLAALESDSVSNYWEGVWWALGLVTTVGFIHAAPTSWAGQVVSAFLMVAGFGMLTLATAAVASLFVAEAEQPDRGREIRFEESALEEIRNLSERLQIIERRLELLQDRETGPD
jgi:voltage-gated potassium channel